MGSYNLFTYCTIQVNHSPKVHARQPHTAKKRKVDTHEKKERVLQEDDDITVSDNVYPYGSFWGLITIAFLSRSPKIAVRRSVTSEK